MKEMPTANSQLLQIGSVQNLANGCFDNQITNKRGRSSNGTVVDFQAFLISCLARDLCTRKCLYCLGRFLIKRGSILPGRLATRQLAIFSSMVWA